MTFDPGLMAGQERKKKTKQKTCLDEAKKRQRGNAQKQNESVMKCKPSWVEQKILECVWSLCVRIFCLKETKATKIKHGALTHCLTWHYNNIIFKDMATWNDGGVG